jgi:MFS family permease
MNTDKNRFISWFLTDLCKRFNDVTQELRASPKWWAMLGIGMGVFMFALDVHIVNLALPTLVESLHTSFATIQWVPLSYLLMSTVFVLGAARLGDMWSKKWLYLGGLLAFTISILRMAPFVLGTGMFQSPNQSAVMGVVPPERLGIASGLLSLSRTLGQTIGLSLIGVLFSLLTMTRTQDQLNINVTNAPIEALVFGVQMSFRLVSLIMMAAAILAAFLWWLEQRKELPSRKQVQESV